MQSNLVTLRRLEQSLKSAISQSRRRFSVTGFDIFIEPHSDAHYLSCAIPATLTPASWPEAITTMQEVFGQQGRRARLEYFHELQPGLATVLEQAGFIREMQAPVMTLAEHSLAKPGMFNAMYLELSSEPEDNLEHYLRQQHIAYGGTASDDGALAWLASMRQGLKTGNLMVAALEQQGSFVSGASLQIGDDIAELAGVWTLPEKQQQGLAYSVCQQLLNNFFASGYSLCWLSTTKNAVRLYTKLGFEEVGTQVNYSSPE